MDCKELMQALNGYVDGAADPALCREFEQYLAGCNPCKVVVDNVRGTIRLYKGENPYPLPPAFRARLHALLRARFQAKYGAPHPRA